MADELCTLRESQGPTQSSGRRSVNERPASPAVAAEQLEAVVMCLEGAALNWFRWENSRHTIGSWEEMKVMIIRQFRSAHEGSIYDRFFSLRQTESVQEYRRKFESLATAMGTMGDQGLQAAFVNGLKMEIQGPLRLLHPNGLIRAMELSESIEANQALVRNYRTGPNRSFTNTTRPSSLIIPESRVPHVTPSPTYSTTSVNSKSTSASSSSSPTSFKRFTEAELREKKKGVYVSSAMVAGFGDMNARRPN
ncbi:hypothetical protein G4B88_005956 [Cannabis sativa]|uniref:Retrotransposon gag domain-containing protein n=1 Tax=Cannabis sativa TaxID=3483 RepID=A0A7J6ICZ9_CANSA|nr:hypothetical protein G4B88_005956 [Cannabis sativa]